MSDEINSEIVEVPNRELEQVRFGTIQATGPDDVVYRATAIAKTLANVINDRRLYTMIKGKKYVQVDGWSTLGAMLGILPREVSVVEHDNGDFEAIVELVRATDGAVVGRASSIVSSDEKTWANRDRYARRSMSVTRATGKAYRLGFSWIMALAGYEATPAEEMPYTDGYFSEVETPKPAVSKPASYDNPVPAGQAHEFGPRPYTPETLKEALDYRANGEYANYEASDKYRNFVAALLSEYFAGKDDKRHAVQEYLFGNKSIKGISGGMVKAAAKWLNAQENPDGSGSSVIDEVSRKELSSVLPEVLKAKGQGDLL